MNGLRDEEGLGLIEIVVSMFMIALLAMAFLPFLMRSITTTRDNTSIATATQLVADQMDDLRLQSPANCAQYTAFRDQATSVQDANRNVTLKVQRSFTCPASSGTADMTISVVDASTNQVLSKATTTVYVTGP